MKKNTGKTLRLFTCTSILFSIISATVQAATVSPSDPNPDAGISYEWTVEISDTDTATFTRFVGAKSWNEPLNPPALKGWTHTSNWVALELLEDVALTLTIDRASGVPLPPNIGGTAGDNLYPAFSLYSGWQMNGDEDHVYNNSGNTDWADEIQFVGNNSNASYASSITQTLFLKSGQYSLAIGGNPPESTLTGFHGYTTTLTTTSATVPEPSTNGLITTAAALMLLSSSRKFIG